MSKRGRGKRGVASCSKKMREDELHVDFDDDMLAMGKQKSKFASWLGLTLRARFPYHIPTNKFDKQRWENLWLEAKDYWNILDDKPKHVFLKKAKKNCTDWRSKLYREYVKINEEPFDKYKYLDQSKWPVFVASKKEEKFLKKSEKARASALKNEDFHRTGRTGYRGLKDNFDGRWKQVSERNSSVKKLQHQCSQLYIAGRASRNKQTGFYEVNHIQPKVNSLVCGGTESKMKADGTYYQGREDPLTRCFGPERGGRSRTVSYVIGSTKVHGGLYKCDRQPNQNGVPTTQTRSDEMNVNQDRQRVDGSMGFHSYASRGSYIDHPDIQDVCKYELLSVDDLPREITIAKGLAYPTRIRTLHTKHMKDSCVKVQVDTVIPGYEDKDVPSETLDDEVKYMDDTLAGFIQWPRNALKIVNIEAPHKSNSASRKASTYEIETSTSVYIPKFVSPEANEDQQQMPIDTINLDDSDDFVESLWAIPIVNQILRPQNEESDQEKQARKIKSALNAIKERPAWVQDIVSELEKHVVFANGWVDITIIHWFAALFYTVSNDGERYNPCAFFGPNSINGEMCQRNPEEVKGHILGVYELHMDKRYFLAPYLANDHWSLFIISPAKKEVFILDSLKGNKDKNNYLLSNVIEDVFKGTKFTWSMVECKQQKGGWECGFMVLGYMMEFVYTYQENFPTNIWRTTRIATQKDIDQLLRIIMPWFLVRMFPNWSHAIK
ncbi:putative Ulp1 protease family catalytic domain, papain-like cysteine peptidase superfamily [Helianthus annuus]|nr:putative Ulp1 protease family catalytic domain, papain-like cysteine peptidase superfamily [Helianthus annuus]KAJ0767988.1 putative Ulp1 protease family catalytic domain, papain-like cysteine peptidase superfamily [Helianthus annuus]